MSRNGRVQNITRPVAGTSRASGWDGDARCMESGRLLREDKQVLQDFSSPRATVSLARGSVFRHGVVNLVGPGRDAAFDAFEVFEALLAQELESFHGADAALAMDVILLVRVRSEE